MFGESPGKGGRAVAVAVAVSEGRPAPGGSCLTKQLRAERPGCCQGEELASALGVPWECLGETAQNAAVNKQGTVRLRNQMGPETPLGLTV